MLLIDPKPFVIAPLHFQSSVQKLFLESTPYPVKIKKKFMLSVNIILNGFDQ